MNSENLDNQGQITGQDEGGDQQENSWQSQAKYFQSEKDKLFEENKNLKQYEKLGKVLQARPDIVEDIKGKLSGKPNANQVPKVERPKDFDPWEAYNDPKSDSFKFREQELESTINSKVNQQVGAQTARLEQEQSMTKLRGELQSRGMSPEEINGFIEFADKDPSEYGIDGILKMYRAFTTADAESPLENVRTTQSSPTTGGILNGQTPQTDSDDETMWKGIMGASDNNKF